MKAMFICGIYILNDFDWIYQAPPSMRSVMQACWLLTIAFGNVIVIIVAEAKAIHRQVIDL